jgi:hypothetical protein
LGYPIGSCHSPQLPLLRQLLLTLIFFHEALLAVFQLASTSLEELFVLRLALKLAPQKLRLLS